MRGVFPRVITGLGAAPFLSLPSSTSPQLSPDDLALIKTVHHQERRRRGGGVDPGFQFRR